MCRFLPLLLLGLAFAVPLHADDRLRDVQTELKNQGFYFGDIDGQPGASTGAAIKRYQIRNGLAVTGEINAETLQALGVTGPAPAPAPATAPADNQVAPPPVRPNPANGPTAPPVNLRRQDPGPETAPRAVRPPADPGAGRPVQPGEDGPPNQPSEKYRGIFAGTPYMNAPRVVQEETYLRAQRTLADRGFLNTPREGMTPAAMEEGLLAFQRNSHLPLSGLLDLETLGALRLLPGRGVGNPGVDAARGAGRIPPPRPYPDQFAR